MGMWIILSGLSAPEPADNAQEEAPLVRLAHLLGAEPISLAASPHLGHRCDSSLPSSFVLLVWRHTKGSLAMLQEVPISNPLVIPTVPRISHLTSQRDRIRLHEAMFLGQTWMPRCNQGCYAVGALR